METSFSLIYLYHGILVYYILVWTQRIIYFAMHNAIDFYFLKYELPMVEYIDAVYFLSEEVCIMIVYSRVVIYDSKKCQKIGGTFYGVS